MYPLAGVEAIKFLPACASDHPSLPTLAETPISLSAFQVSDLANRGVLHSRREPHPRGAAARRQRYCVVDDSVGTGVEWTEDAVR